MIKLQFLDMHEGNLDTTRDIHLKYYDYNICVDLQTEWII